MHGAVPVGGAGSVTVLVTVIIPPGTVTVTAADPGPGTETVPGRSGTETEFRPGTIVGPRPVPEPVPLPVPFRPAGDQEDA